MNREEKVVVVRKGEEKNLPGVHLVWRGAKPGGVTHEWGVKKRRERRVE